MRLSRLSAVPSTVRQTEDARANATRQKAMSLSYKLGIVSDGTCSSGMADGQASVRQRRPERTCGKPSQN